MFISGELFILLLQFLLCMRVHPCNTVFLYCCSVQETDQHDAWRSGITLPVFHASLLCVAVSQEAKRLEEIRIRKEKEKDYLAPFLMKLNNPERLTREQAAQVRYDCLENLRRRLVNQAELIQTKFEKVRLGICMLDSELSPFDNNRTDSMAWINSRLDPRSSCRNA